MSDFAAEAGLLDARDVLAPFRQRFLVTDPDLCYLDGNSLGRPLHDTIRLVRGTSFCRKIALAEVTRRGCGLPQERE